VVEMRCLSVFWAGFTRLQADLNWAKREAVADQAQHLATTCWLYTSDGSCAWPGWAEMDTTSRSSAPTHPLSVSLSLPLL
jgi:hypothetical protein